MKSRCSFCKFVSPAILLAAVHLAVIPLTDVANAQVMIGGHTLTDWNSPAFPIAPARPIAPALPVTPVRPGWNPWYQPNVIVLPTYNGFYAPPTRWDAARWDEQQREMPEPPPKPAPKPRQGPQVMQWNAATGRAEPVQVERWDAPKTESEQPAQTPVPPPSQSDDAASLNRWDK